MSETPEQKAAFIVAQAAMLNCELEGMKALNTERERNGFAAAYDNFAFAELQERYCHLNYNAVLEYFRS